MYLILIIIGCIVSFSFGIFCAALVTYHRTFGTIKMMPSDDGDPYLYLDMDRRPEGMGNYKYVVFKVDFRDGGSHE